MIELNKDLIFGPKFVIKSNQARHVIKDVYYTETETLSFWCPT